MGELFHSFHVPDEVLHWNRGIPERALERVAVHFIVVGKDDATAIRVLHLEVAALAVNLDEAQPLECREHLTPGQQRELHRERATTS